MNRKIRVAIVEDMDRIRSGLSRLIDQTPDMCMAGSYASVEDALSGMESNAPDVLLSDIGFPGLSGEVVIGLTVDPCGRILEGSILSSTTGVDAFDQELLRKVLDWRLRSFPDSRPKFISVPFLFPLQGH